ncbi:MAG TPA: hypothetical protein V6D47_14655 [Oscillatoriaceae cyanobacterium]
MPVVVRSEGITDASPTSSGLSLSEVATRLAIASALPHAEAASPLSFCLQWLEPAHVGVEFLAEAELAHLGAEIAWVEGLLISTAGITLARFSASFRRVPAC